MNPITKAVGRAYRHLVRRVFPHRVYDGFEWEFYRRVRRFGAPGLHQVGLTDSEVEACRPIGEAARKLSFAGFMKYLRALEAPARAALPVEFPIFGAGMSKVPQNLGTVLGGKRVAIVGPAGYLVGAGMGLMIDAFDVVARVNYQWPVSDHLVPDYGGRADILYHCCFGDPPISPLLGRALERLSLVCMEHGFASKKLRRHCELVGVSAIYVSDLYANLAASLRSYPTTGLVGIVHLMSQPIAELHVFGMTMQATAYHGGYPSPGAGALARTRGRSPRRVWYHRPALQASYLLALAARNPRLRIDPKAVAAMSRLR